MPRKMREEVAEFKRAAILKEAARQFYKKGYDGTRIDEIAASLGVTKPFIYYHFKNKTELLDEIAGNPPRSRSIPSPPRSPRTARPSISCVTPCGDWCWR